MDYFNIRLLVTNMAEDFGKGNRDDIKEGVYAVLNDKEQFKKKYLEKEGVMGIGGDVDYTEDMAISVLRKLWEGRVKKEEFVREYMVTPYGGEVKEDMKERGKVYGGMAVREGGNRNKKVAELELVLPMGELVRMRGEYLKSDKSKKLIRAYIEKLSTVREGGGRRSLFFKDLLNTGKEFEEGSL